MRLKCRWLCHSPISRILKLTHTKTYSGTKIPILTAGYIGYREINSKPNYPRENRRADTPDHVEFEIKNHPQIQCALFQRKQPFRPRKKLKIVNLLVLYIFLNTVLMLLI